MKSFNPLIYITTSAFAIRLISHGLGFFGLLMLTIIFDAAYFGRYSLIISLGLMVSPILNLGLHLPLIRLVSQNSEDIHQTLITSGFSILLLAWWLLLLTLAVTASFINPSTHTVFFTSLLTYSVCIASEVAVSHYLLSVDRPVASAALTSGPRNIIICIIGGAVLIEPATSPLSFYWFIWIPASVAIVVNLVILGTQINFAAPQRSILYFLMYLKSPNIRNVQTASLTNGIVAQLSANLMVVGSAAVFSDSLVGVLAAARRLLSLLELSITAILMPSLMKITRYLQHGQIQDLSRYMGKLATVTFALALCYNICVWICAYFEWPQTGVIADPRLLYTLKILAFGFLISTLFGPSFLALQVANSAWNLVWANLITISCNSALVVAVFFGMFDEKWFVVGIALTLFIHRAILYFVLRLKTNIRSDILAVSLKGS